MPQSSLGGRGKEPAGGHTQRWYTAVFIAASACELQDELVWELLCVCLLGYTVS
jgi:hypothetical protein